MASTSDIFDQVRAAVDIVEVIGEHVALTRAGREFKGLCPFHDDHKPSMAVVPNKQIFHCFVCGTGGDVFKFVTGYHKLTNGEALRMLAQRGGIKLPELPKRGGYGAAKANADGPSEREQIAATNEWACSFFEEYLRTPPAAAGLAYLHSRGLTDETITKFRLGMAPDSWTALVTAALRQGIKTEALDAAGLVKKRQDGSAYDIFRNRVIFPIIDATGGIKSGGRVIAFGGRVLEEKRDEQGMVVEAKYLNSPETRLFVKSQSVYGLNHARQTIIRTRTAVVVEGYMDVIACHQAGIANVIATLGTALTQEHARILKNYAQTIALVFDSDDAGFRAADRAMEVFVRTALDIKLTSVPDGKDPCDFCMKSPDGPGGGGGDAFQKLVDSAADALSYQWNRVKKQFHATDSLSARQESITQFMRFVAAGLESAGANGQNMDPVRRGLLFSKLAGLVGMGVEEVGSTLRRLGREGMRNPRPQSTSQAPPADQASAQPGANWESMQPGNAPEESPARLDVASLKGLDAAEGWLLGGLLAQPPLYEKVREDMALALFIRLRPLAAALIEILENHGDLASCSLAEIVAALADPELVRQAIELEKRISDWLDPQLSPAHVKMLAQCQDDRGFNLELAMRQYLRELCNARSAEDPAVAADLDGSVPPPVEPDPELQALLAIQGAAERNKQGGNRANVGLGK